MSIFEFLAPYMDIVAGLLELIGLVLIGRKMKVGFLFNLGCCAAWTYYGLTRPVYGLLIVVVPGIIINIVNYLRWLKEDRKTKALNEKCGIKIGAGNGAGPKEEE